MRTMLRSGLSASNPHRPRRFNPDPEPTPDPDPDPDPETGGQSDEDQPDPETEGGDNEDQPDPGADEDPNEAQPDEYVPVVPEDLSAVKDLEAWVTGEDEDPQRVAARAQAVLDLEMAKPKRKRRTTLVASMTDTVLQG